MSEKFDLSSVPVFTSGALPADGFWCHPDVLKGKLVPHLNPLPSSFPNYTAPAPPAPPAERCACVCHRDPDFAGEREPQPTHVCCGTCGCSHAYKPAPPSGEILTREELEHHKLNMRVAADAGDLWSDEYAAFSSVCAEVLALRAALAAATDSEASWHRIADERSGEIERLKRAAFLLSRMAIENGRLADGHGAAGAIASNEETHELLRSMLEGSRG